MYCLAPKIKWKNKKGLCYRHNKRQRFPTGFCWDLLNCSMYRFFTGWHIFLSRQCFIIKSDNEPRDSPQNSGAGEKQRTLSKFLGQAVPAVLCRPTFAIFHQGFITTYVEQFDQWRLIFFSPGSIWYTGSTPSATEISQELCTYSMAFWIWGNKCWVFS